jgi:hypothetical protein
MSERNEYIEPCSDGGCILRDKSQPRGQHTNGGCQHLKERGPALTHQLMAMGAEIVRLRAEMAEREAAGWAELAGVADLLGYSRARSLDFGEVDVVEVRALAERLRARDRDARLLVHALLHRLGVDDTELTHAEVMRAAERCESHELVVTERHEWATPVRVESWLRFRREVPK